MIKGLLIGLVKGYRMLLSPWLGSSCRFEPTCSAYALQALEQHGALAGSYLTVKRLGRCQPWCAGGCDPVPADKPRLFSSLLGKPATGDAVPSDDSLSSTKHSS